jgi:hypothetical protein
LRSRRDDVGIAYGAAEPADEAERKWRSATNQIRRPRRFDALSETSFDYVAREQEQRQWRQLAGRLEQLVAETGRPTAEPWAQVEKRLEQEFGDAFAQARGRVPQPVHEFFQTRQMPLSEYVEWLLLGTE